MVGVALLAALLTPLPASADPRESTVPIDNPDLTKACGLDVLMIIDESGSIADPPDGGPMPPRM